MSERKQIDWAKLATLYVHGTASLRELALEHGVGLASLKTHAASGGWVRLRKQATEQVRAKLHHAALKERTQGIIEWNEADLTLARALRSQVSQALVRLAHANGLSDEAVLERLSAISATAERVQRIARLALGATTENSGLSSLPSPEAAPTLGDLYRTVVVVSPKPDDDAGADDGGTPEH